MDANNESRKADEASSSANSAASGRLPDVESPSLAPGEGAGHKVSTAVALFKGDPSNGDGQLDRAGWTVWSKLSASPFAAAVLLSLGIGLFAAAVSAFSYGPSVKTLPSATITEVTSYKETIAQLSAEVAALKAAQEASSRATAGQFKGLTDRFDRADRAQAEPAARLAKISESVDRLERRMASAALPPQTVVAVPAPAAGGTSIHASNRNDITGSIPLPPQPVPATRKDTSRLPVIQGWTLRKVVEGTAFIHSREGMIEVGIGDGLPGGGKVEDIRRENGRWVVVTSRGLVVPKENVPRPRASLTVAR